MEHAGYVITGWTVTGVVFATYALVVVRRTRRVDEYATRPTSPSSDLA